MQQTPSPEDKISSSSISLCLLNECILSRLTPSPKSTVQGEAKPGSNVMETTGKRGVGKDATMSEVTVFMG